MCSRPRHRTCCCPWRVLVLATRCAAQSSRAGRAAVSPRVRCPSPCPPGARADGAAAVAALPAPRRRAAASGPASAARSLTHAHPPDNAVSPNLCDPRRQRPAALARLSRGTPHHGQPSSAHATTRPCRADHCRRALMVLAPAASAHVTVSSPDASPGGFGKLVFRVPTESETASTVKLSVTLPTDTPFALVSAKSIGRVVRRDHGRGA